MTYLYFCQVAVLVKNLLNFHFCNMMQIQTNSLFLSKNKGARALKWDWDKLFKLNVQTCQITQTKQKGNKCILEPKLCTCESQANTNS
jgi:hypothetical protein